MKTKWRKCKNQLKKKDLKELKNKHTETNSTITKIKNTLEGINSRISEANEKIFEDIIAENFSNMEKKIVNQVQQAQRIPYRINPRRNMPRHILIKD